MTRRFNLKLNLLGAMIGGRETILKRNQTKKYEIHNVCVSRHGGKKKKTFEGRYSLLIQREGLARGISGPDS